MMYYAWKKLIVMAMWQMLLTGILTGFLTRVGYDIYKGKNIAKNKISLIVGLALMMVDAVVAIYIISSAAANECPLFVVYRIFYEYMLIGMGMYWFWHIIPVQKT